ncbi:hypothetical protein GCM10009504_40290 [Pseudomonas laurentiana]|nr:hypothetical protein GCM10009504_40290 [Pseudomonas laurentiana]
MRITSKQKKFWIPLAGFIASFIAWAAALGTIWGIVLPLPMALCAGVFLACNIEPVIKSTKAWLDRDGWK